MNMNKNYDSDFSLNKYHKITELLDQVIQRLITAQVLDAKGAKYVVETMWMLMESGIEEVHSSRYFYKREPII